MSGIFVPELFRSFFAGSPAPAYVLSQAGTGLVDLFAETWLERLRSEGSTAEVTRWTPTDLERESLTAVWRSPSFFVRYRIYTLPDLAELKKGPLTEIASWLQAPDPLVMLVLPCSKASAAKAVSSHPAVRSLSPREDQAASALGEYAAWIARKAGKKLPGDAAVFLARWAGLESAALKVEVEKLLSFAEGRDEIGEREIREVCASRGEVDPFRLGEELLRGNRAECLSLVRRFAAAASTEDYHKLLGAVAWQARKRPQARTAGILQALTRMDRGIKGESGLSPEQLLEIHVLRLLG